MQARVLISIALGFLLSGCSVTKKQSTEPYFNNEGRDSESITITEVVKNNITNESFNIQRADIKINQEKVTVRFTASLKFRKPDSLMITVRSGAGIEAGRALLTDDTVIVNDRVNKMLLIGKPEKIGAKYGIEPGLIYAVFGDVKIDENAEERDIRCDKGVFSDIFEMNDRKVIYTVDCRERKAIKSYFEGDITSGNITVQFYDIKRINNVKCPMRIMINDDKNSMDITIEIRKIEIPWEGRINFNPGSNYKVVKIR